MPIDRRPAGRVAPCALAASTLILTINAAALGADFARSTTLEIAGESPLVFGITATRSDTGEQFTLVREIAGARAHETWMLGDGVTPGDPAGGPGSVEFFASRGEVDGGYLVNLHFSVTAFAVDTTVSAFVAEARFPTLANAAANIWASIEVQDMDGDGAEVTSLRPYAYEAYFNEFRGPLFGGLIGTGFTTERGLTTATSTAWHPAPGEFAPFPETRTVTDASATFLFELSANDAVQVRSEYMIIPSPGAVSLLGLGGLAALRRLGGR